MPPTHEQAMASHSGTTFGKREMHRVWSQRGSVFVCVSQVRGWTVVVLLGLLSAGLGLAAFRSMETAPPGGLYLAVALAILSFASLWWALRTARAVAMHRLVMRLDPRRFVVHGASGDVVLRWEDVSLAFGPAFLTISGRPGDRAAERQSFQEVSVPLLLLPGGSAGLKKAIASVRPDALDRSAP